MVQERVTRLETKVELIDAKLNKITNSLDMIGADLNKYKGAWGMLLMVGGAMMAAFTAWTKLK